MYRKSASRFSRGTVLNMLKQSRINIMRGKKGRNYISRQACFVNCFTLIYIYIYIYTHTNDYHVLLFFKRAMNKLINFLCGLFLTFLARKARCDNP